MMKHTMLQLGFVLLAQLTLAQATQSAPPCEYSGAVLQDDGGKIVRLGSKEMKARATKKVDLRANFMGHLDFRATITIEVLVGPDGTVLCSKGISEFPVADKEVEKAVRQWKFQPTVKDAKRVASLGLLEFYLCNITCGDEGTSTSLLR